MVADEVRNWFDRSAALPPERRRAFLEANCPGATLRAEVLSLLEFDRQETRDFIPSRVLQHALETLRVRPSGSRADGTVDQRVAVKFAQVPAAKGAFAWC